jgi:hypothetical protein
MVAGSLEVQSVSGLWRAPTLSAQHGRIFASANPTRSPNFFLDSADHHSSFLGITHGDASIRYSFVFHLDKHVALTCLSTYLCIIGG